MKKKFGIIGAGGHAKVVIEIIEEMGDSVVGIADHASSSHQLLGYQVNAELPQDEMSVLIAIGNNRTRKILAAQMNHSFGSAIHPKATLSSRSTLGPGSMVMAGATINSCTVIGAHCIVNTNASIDHDCVLADFVHISPGASLAGNVTVGEGSHIGIGSSIIQGVCIGQWVTIGAGAVIINDVPDYAVVVGVPGKIIKYNKE